jgi:hypothetical protein
MNLLQNVTKIPVGMVKTRDQWYHLPPIAFAAMIWAWFNGKGRGQKMARALRAIIYLSTTLL